MNETDTHPTQSGSDKENRLLTRREFLLLSAAMGSSALLSGCFPSAQAEAPSELSPKRVDPERSAAIEHALGKANEFLRARYDDETGLLQESTETEARNYWIKTSNYVAVYALRATGESALANRITATMTGYGDYPHGVVEILEGTPTAWPPTTTKAQPDVVKEFSNGKRILSETRVGGNVMNDWESAYTDLCLYGALNAFNAGDTQEAARRYQSAMTLFGGDGFADNPYKYDNAPEGKRYDTYKLALAVYIGHRLGIDTEQNTRMTDILLGMQNEENGGFTTKYINTGDELTQIGDANVETTSYSMLALSSITS